MRTAVDTIAEQAAFGWVHWYVGEGDNLAHLIGRRYNHDDGEADQWMRLCGSVITRPVATHTTAHCKSCANRVRTFVEAALVEPEIVEESLTVTVQRPIGSRKTLLASVQNILDRQGTWHGEITSHSETPITGGES